MEGVVETVAVVVVVVVEGVVLVSAAGYPWISRSGQRHALPPSAPSPA
jgi:hypothetical protein